MASVETQSSSGSGTKVRAWDLPTRLFKWSLVTLIVCGYLSNKFGASVPGWHKWNGYAILILLVFRLLWGFVGGSTARFAAFVDWPWNAAAYGLALLKGKSPKYLGHNPLGGYMVLALMGLAGLQVLTGLYSGDEDRIVIEGPLAKTIADASVVFATKIHHYVFDGIVVLALVHIGVNLFYTFGKKDPLIQGMVTGYKPVEAYADMPEARSGSAVAAVVCLVIAAVVVLGGITLMGGNIFK